MYVYIVMHNCCIQYRT